MARFHWMETADRLEELLAGHAVEIDESRRCFIACDDPGVFLRPPPVYPITDDVASAEAYLERLDPDLGAVVVLLLQAGASAMGYWRDDALIRHKCLKRYVVRGQGRAQPLHAKTRGKSRYGSRLRLQNAKRQLEETNLKLREWWSEEGEPDRIFFSVPVRTWPELNAATPSPPFPRDDARLVKIPRDVHVPNFEELARTWRFLGQGESSGR
ncbi:MAG: hypothetical protein CMJ83_04415 [Planctomycetes bacterium]|nr:hypothetical protein [Planctomycetota bacterium]